MTFNLNNIGLKQKFYISSLVFASVIAGIAYFVIIPVVGDIENLKHDIDFQKTDLDKKYRQNLNINKLTEDINKIELEMASLNEVYISKDEELNFIKTLETTANNNNVKQSINLDFALKNNPNGGKLPLKLITQGNFINQFNYLLDLEALNYYINIKSLNLASGGSPAAFPNSSSQIVQTLPSVKNITMTINADVYSK